MKSPDPSARRSPVRYVRQDPRHEAAPPAEARRAEHPPTLEEGLKHIVRALKEGKSFRQMQAEWRSRHS